MNVTTGTTLCGYCGTVFSVIHGHTCYPTAVATGTAPSAHASGTLGTLLTPEHLCPDLLRYENIGGADGLRGRVIRGLFWLLRVWPP